MKKFIIKSLLIVCPFVFAGIFFKINFNKNAGDLSRIGHINGISKEYNHPDSFFNDSVFFDNFSNTDKKNATILNIGDSFSRQELNGYNGYLNFLSMNENISIINHTVMKNPVERLNEIIKGDLLDSLNIKYIILESAEREIIKRLIKPYNIKHLNFSDIKLLDEQNIQNELNNSKNKKKFPGFFSKGTLFYTLNRLANRDLKSIALKFKTSERLFLSSNLKEIIVLNDDIKNLEINNNIKLIQEGNLELNIIANKLRSKGIELIVLIAPDKYSFYYEELLNNNLPEPILFNVLDTLSKNYLFFNTKKYLQNYKPSFKSIYFYDDTHWTPIASKIISNKIKNLIFQNE
jgi:hypothetical protein